MVSVIIPTLWKVKRLEETLKELELCDFVSEIILIDNTGLQRSINNKKLVYVLEKENTYVNPSWNKGVSVSNNEKICILNDDVWFDWNIFRKIEPMISKNIGLIGMSPNNYSSGIGDFKITKIDPDWKSKKGIRPYGYGCCFFIHKDNWIEIPNDMKIWAGDDFLFYYNNNLENYIVDGIKCEGYMSYTSDMYEIEFDDIKKNDMNIMKKNIELKIVDNYLKNTIWDV